MSIHSLRYASASLILGLLWPVLPVSRVRAEPPAPRSEVTNYAFEDELVHADGVSPTLEVLHGRTRAARESLIRVRDQFLVELRKSVERL
jgi:hypothetical protein